jgi:MFS family permease
MQIPCGFFFDHIGPRRAIVGMLIVATIGGIIFTLAPNWPILLTGRVLLGAGFGVMLIGTMVVISRWFPPDRFSTLTAMVLSIGLLGNLAATTPLAWPSAGAPCSAPPSPSLRSPPSPSGWWCATLRPAILSLPASRSHYARCCKACWRCCATRG